MDIEVDGRRGTWWQRVRCGVALVTGSKNLHTVCEKTDKPGERLQNAGIYFMDGNSDDVNK
jgi:hypothetical protein